MTESINNDNNKYEIVDMSNVPKVEPNKVNKPKTIFHGKVWKERTTQKGDRMLYRKYKDTFVNVGFLKSNHIWLKYDNEFIRDHKLKYTTDEQLIKDVDNLLEFIIKIGD